MSRSFGPFLFGQFCSCFRHLQRRVLDRGRCRNASMSATLALSTDLCPSLVPASCGIQFRRLLRVLPSFLACINLHVKNWGVLWAGSPDSREFTYKTTLRGDAFKSDNPIALSLKMCSKCERGKQFAERPRDRAQKVGTPYEDQKKNGPKTRAWCT